MYAATSTPRVYLSSVENSPSGFEKAAKNAQIAQRAFEYARKRLDQHIAMHACQ
jgi:hypothetical protein